MHINDHCTLLNIQLSQDSAATHLMGNGKFSPAFTVVYDGFSFLVAHHCLNLCIVLVCGVMLSKNRTGIHMLFNIFNVILHYLQSGTFVNLEHITFSKLCQNTMYWSII